MTILTTNDAARAGPSTLMSVASLCGSFSHLFVSLLKSYKRYRDREAAIAMLHGFSDYELKDIGLSRDAIEAAVYGYFSPNSLDRHGT